MPYIFVKHIYACASIVGAIVGMGLVYTGEKFHVDVDERETAVREQLPGNNCGACKQKSSHQSGCF